MDDKIFLKLKKANPWHFVWISVIFSELATVLLSTLQSYIRWGKISKDILSVGAVDALFVPLVAAAIILYFTRHATELAKINEKLNQEIEERRLAEASRQESEARYQALFEGSPVPYFLSTR